MPVKTVVAVVLIPSQSPVKKPLIPFHTVSVTDWIPSQSPEKKSPRPSPMLCTPEQTVDQTPPNHSEISPQCFTISITATTAATTAAMIPMIGRIGTETAVIAGIAVVERKPTSLPTMLVTDPTAVTTLPTPTMTGPTAAAMSAALTIASCIPGDRPSHAPLRAVTTSLIWVMASVIIGADASTISAPRSFKLFITTVIWSSGSRVSLNVLSTDPA